MRLTDAEVEYLQSQPIGRLSPHRSARLATDSPDGVLRDPEPWGPAVARQRFFHRVSLLDRSAASAGVRGRGPKTVSRALRWDTKASVR
jgi:hypothetical protein